MTAKLSSQLERYTAAVVDQQAPITAAEAQALVGAIRELPEIPLRKATPLRRHATTPSRFTRPWGVRGSSRTRRGVWVAVAAAVVTILLVGILPFLDNSEQTPPADTVVTPTTLSDSPTPTTPTTLSESSPTTIPSSVPTVILADLDGD